MKIIDLGGTPQELIQKVINAKSKVPPPADQYNLGTHKVLNTSERQDKAVETDSGPSIVKVNRQPLALQRLIIKRAVAFLFANQPVLSAEPSGDQQATVFNALKSILHGAKSSSINKKVAEHLFRTTEVAEVWYPMFKGERMYGTEGKYQFRVKVLSPALGDKLYPVFNEYGDMIAFGREYSLEISGKVTFFFDLYTDEEWLTLIKGSNGWEVHVKDDGAEVRGIFNIGKIPVVYASQEEVEYSIVQHQIERLETLLSNFGDTNDYHAAPKILVKGQIDGWAKKGESGAILQMGANGSAEYLSWNHAPESVKLEIETLLRFIYSLSQTPDISFESVKGLGDISGVALRMLFLDAHLKVSDKRQIFDEYLTRRINILKAFIGASDPSLRTAAMALDVEPEIQPFMINDEASMIDYLINATGGKAVMSQRTAIGNVGYVDDVDGELKQIQDEERSRNILNALESGF